MQTIKTAAVVVLMLTVLYGGYVSLTTPPDPLPDEISDILVIDESSEGALGIANRLPSGLKLDEPPAGVLASPNVSQSVPELISPAASDSRSAAEPAFGMHSNAASPATYGSSFADLPPPAQNRDVDQTAPTKLPEVGGSAPQINPGPVDSYASTASDFNLPDPNVAASKFDASRGTPFAGTTNPASDNTQFQMSDLPSGGAVSELGGSLEPANSSGSTPTDGNDTAAKETKGLINAFSTADAMFAKGQLKEALATLSVFYGMPNLTDAQRSQLLSRLDPLAREVIYSKRHLLEQPHRVTASETLQEIASNNEVPWQLLANINRIDDPMAVLPGSELKIVRGPFRAEVDLTAKRMTMYLGDLYAGRFQIEVGSDPTPTPGTFTIHDKQSEHVYYDASGNPIPAGSPDNPYGNMWLDLGGEICIHGSPNTVQPTKSGCISVAGDYADDVYGILSQGSSVTIRR